MSCISSNFRWILCAVWLTPAAAIPQEWEIDWEAVDTAVKTADRWAAENIDDAVLQRFGELDRELIRGFLERAQKEFQSRYVVDVALLRSSATRVLPMLERYEETLPYALWLRTRMDYLEVAEQLRKEMLPPGKSAAEVPTPSAHRQQQAWNRVLSDRPWPTAAKAYIPQLKPIFVTEGVPPELVWVAEVESSFNSQAKSPAGAAGLFQLMPATAKRFGLATDPKDERLLPVPSARAAARYLKFLYNKFKDWQLALAAYNSGEGTVQRALTARQARNFDQVATGLPAETQLYVPKVEATLVRREGIKLAEL